MKYTKAFLSFMAILAVCFSCRPVETPFGPPALTATIDGEAFSVDSLLVSANYSVVDARTRIFSISGAPPAFDGIAEGIGLSMISSDSTDIQEGETYVAGSLSKTAGGNYFIDSGSSNISANAIKTGVATISITELDFDRKVISGTFSFDASDPNDPDKIYQIRDGKFINVSFE